MSYKKSTLRCAIGARRGRHVFAPRLWARRKPGAEESRAERPARFWNPLTLGPVTISFRAADIPSSDLAEKPLGQPSAEPLTGEILTRSQVFFDEPQITSGTWECEPGSSRWEFTARGEIIYVLSGRMTVEEDGGTPVELTAGSSCIFPIGWCGVWTVHETLRKVFVVYRPAAL